MAKIVGAVMMLAAAVVLSADAGWGAGRAKCTSIQARCAVQIGGSCDPVSGHWVYGKYGIGGSNKGGAFDACVSAELAKRKK
jgi:hypothetical protein